LCVCAQDVYFINAAVQQIYVRPPILEENPLNMLTTEQLLAAHKANVETLFGLTQKAFEGLERLVELNMQLAKAAMVDAADGTRAVLSVKDAQELLALQQKMLMPTAEKATTYGRQAYEIAAAASAEAGKVAEAQMADVQKAMRAMVDNAVMNAPAGSESAVALVQSAMSAAQNAFESVQQASRQAANVAQASFQTMTETAAKATRPTAGRGKRG
jgi:phasin family protein